MKKVNSIALIGLSGSYKSTLGKLLASKLGMHFFDTDDYFCFDRGVSICDFFDKFGEKAFRKEENRIIKQCYQYENVVIATGGGVVLNDENMQLLQQNCLVMYLSATPKTCYMRVKNDKSRPLLRENALIELEAMYAHRKDLYKKYADIVLNTNKKTSISVLEESIAKISSYYNI